MHKNIHTYIHVAVLQMYTCLSIPVLWRWHGSGLGRKYVDTNPPTGMDKQFPNNWLLSQKLGQGVK